MPLDENDEARVVELENFKEALESWIAEKLDFSDREFINRKIEEIESE